MKLLLGIIGAIIAGYIVWFMTQLYPVPYKIGHLQQKITQLSSDVKTLSQKNTDLNTKYSVLVVYLSVKFKINIPTLMAISAHKNLSKEAVAKTINVITTQKKAAAKQYLTRELNFTQEETKAVFQIDSGLLKDNKQ